MPSLFTSESVAEGHPDKLADQVSDAILDAILAKDPLARVACEAIVTTGLVIVVGEITTDCYVDIPRIIRQTVRDVGYTRAKYGFDAETCGIMTSIDEQSPDIAHGVDVGGAGDSGMMFGFACDETPELMPLPIMLAHGLVRKLSEVRRNKSLSYLRPDGKAQVTVRYGDDGKPEAVDNVVISAQHHDEVPAEQLRADITEHVVNAVIPPELRDAAGPRGGGSRSFINPTGRFVIGGPVADAGLTGRKIMVDTYGGFARHGGGCFSGKDPTKVDRAGAYGARYVAKNIVASGLARSCEVQLSYAIGVPKPVAVRVETFGTGRVPDATIATGVSRLFDLSPLGIIKELNLRRPLYRQTAVYGHFGRTDIEAPWESTSRATELSEELSSKA
jgi:S-adenosylmethionine synthetase